MDYELSFALVEDVVEHGAVGVLLLVVVGLGVLLVVLRLGGLVAVVGGLGGRVAGGVALGVGALGAVALGSRVAVGGLAAVRVAGSPEVFGSLSGGEESNGECGFHFLIFEL